jgi:nucleotide-binding universal stress UspA family protein
VLTKETGMSIRTVLVHLHDSVHCAARLRCAAQLAVDVGGRLVGMYLVPARELSPSMAALLPADAVAAYLEESGARQDRAQRMFSDVAASLALRASDWIAPAGNPLDAALAHGRCADLLVLGQGDPQDKASQMAGELIATTLLGLGRPILVIPYIGTSTPIGRRILIAFDGGREASRAVADALPLLERAAHVDVLVGTRDEARFGGYGLASQRLDRWLQDHGVHARMERYEPPAGDTGEFMLSRAADFGSDLVVMGGYAHARVRQTLLGGVTRTMLQSMTTPVLMSH